MKKSKLYYTCPICGRNKTFYAKKCKYCYWKTMIGEGNPNYDNHKLAGENHFNYGKPRTKETRKKIKLANTGNIKLMGKNNYNWIGGLPVILLKNLELKYAKNIILFVNYVVKMVGMFIT